MKLCRDIASSNNMSDRVGKEFLFSLQTFLSIDEPQRDARIRYLLHQEK
jgi:hypothetical protein